MNTGRRLPRLLVPFRTPAYRRLAAALVLNMFALGVWVVALVWEVIRLGGGPTQLSLVATASSVGILLPALLAGVVADRVPQKSILLVVSGAELMGMTVVALGSQSDQNSLALLAVVSFALGVASAFYYPAYSAWLPALVPMTHLLAVNGFEGMVRPTLNQAIGPAVAGTVVAVASPAAAVWVAVAASAGGLAALTTVPRTPVRREVAARRSDTATHPVRSAVQDVREGFGYMVRTPWLLASLLFASLLVLLIMGPIEVLIPFLVKDRLDGGPNDHARVLVAFGLGGALASVLVGSLPMPRRYLTAMNLTWGLGSLPLVVIGRADQVWVVVVAALVLGAAFGGPMVIWGTLLQRRVPPELLGRVSSLDFFVSLSLMPVSMALAGPVAELIGLRTTFLVAGAMPGVIAMVAILWARLPQDELAHPLRG